MSRHRETVKKPRRMQFEQFKRQQSNIQDFSKKCNLPDLKKLIWCEKVDSTEIATTGCTSKLFDVSSGVKPIFALAYCRI